MLVLSREKGYSIMIGDNVEVIVLNVYEDKVDFKVTHPKDIPVYPRELFDVTQRLKKDPENEKLQRDVEEIREKWDNLKESEITRQRDESFMIGETVEFIIVDVRLDEVNGNKARIGITAPKDVSVHRKEIWEAIQAERAEQGKRKREF